MSIGSGPLISATETEAIPNAFQKSIPKYNFCDSGGIKYKRTYFSLAAY